MSESELLGGLFAQWDEVGGMYRTQKRKVGDEMVRRLKAVCDLHRPVNAPKGSPDWCHADRENWPCPTHRILNGGAENV